MVPPDKSFANVIVGFAAQAQRDAFRQKCAETLPRRAANIRA